MKAPGRPGAFLYLLRTFFRCWTGDRRLLSSCCLSGDRVFSTGQDRHGLPVPAGLKDSFLSCAAASPRPVSASNGPVSFFVRLQVLRVVPSLFPAHLCEQSALGRGSLRGDPSRASRGVPPQKSAVPVSDAGALRASTAEIRRFPPPMETVSPPAPAGRRGRRRRPRHRRPGLPAAARSRGRGLRAGAVCRPGQRRYRRQRACGRG